MLKLISSILSTGLVERLGAAWAASRDAKTDQARIEADTMVAIEEQRLRRALAGGHLVTGAQLLLAAPFIVYIWKLVVWDKVLGWGVTDALSPELAEIQFLVVIFLFGPPAVRRVFGR